MATKRLLIVMASLALGAMANAEGLLLVGNPTTGAVKVEMLQADGGGMATAVRVQGVPLSATSFAVGHFSSTSTVAYDVAYVDAGSLWVRRYQADGTQTDIQRVTTGVNRLVGIGDLNHNGFREAIIQNLDGSITALELTYNLVIRKIFSYSTATLGTDNVAFGAWDDQIAFRESGTEPWIFSVVKFGISGIVGRTQEYDRAIANPPWDGTKWISDGGSLVGFTDVNGDGSGDVFLNFTAARPKVLWYMTYDFATTNISFIDYTTPAVKTDQYILAAGD